MNKRIVLYTLGRLLMLEGFIMIFPMVVSLIYHEKSYLSFVYTILILIALGYSMSYNKPQNTNMYAKESFVIVGLAWILFSIFGALPFYFSGSISSGLDCLFESVAGFTTTGSTILKNIDVLPHGILFWRSLSNWIGGMGVLVFVLAISPSEKRSMHLMRAEMAGPSVGKLEPKIRSTAKILYKIYIFLTLLLVIFLLIGGMDLYDSVIHAFSTAGTGGFTNHNSSISYFNSAYIDGVLIVFMFLFGINFNLFYFLIVKHSLSSVNNEELRTYIGIIIGSIILITINISNLYATPLKALRYAIFQVVSIISTTGFFTTDYNLWPEFSKNILMAIMLIGACSGSTSGGIKISRLLIMFKIIKKEIRKMIHPRSVNLIKMDGHIIEEETISGIYLYLITYIMILVVSILVVSLDNFDFETSFSAVLAMITNVGPGISLVGPVESFYEFSPLSKIVLCGDMLLGRLEIFPYLILFSPSLWRKRF